MFKDLKIILPFTNFKYGVLTKMNVSPTQLHPNSWAFMKIFSTLCDYLNIAPIANKFLYFY